jgi:uncharacterized protein (DUF736 family)
MDKLLKIAGLYKQKRKKDGKTYLTGKLNFATRLLVLPNEKKQADNEPDFNVFLVPIEEKPKPRPEAAPPDAGDDL